MKIKRSVGNMRNQSNEIEVLGEVGSAMSAVWHQMMGVV
jgi:hypothetical protein